MAMAWVYILVGLFLLIGLIGSVLPFLPGTLLIWVGAFIYAWATDFDTVGTAQLLILAFLTALAYGVDYVAGALGVKKIGGSRWAMLGATLGAVVGVFFGPLGLILGPIIGAVTAELARSQEIQASLQSGVGSALGMLAGAVARFSLAVIMVGLFLWWIWVG
jgi:uncharacterized protein YqgC (DUF456 family)